jgi:hypothetical protein
MANDLVVFPEAGDLWEEVEGPGMYVLAVLPRTDRPDRCAVGAAITLLRPQGKLLTSVPPLWTADAIRADDVALLEEAASLFEERGERAKAATLRAQFPSSDLSMQIVQATQMGTTARTIRSTKTGEFWQAQWGDLTPAGILHLHQIHACFVRPPILLTFLGDEGNA